MISTLLLKISGGRTMRYSIETTENGVNETLEVDGNLYKKEWEREENGLFRCKQKNFVEQMEKEIYEIGRSNT